MAALAGLLGDLPSRGLLTAVRPGAAFSGHPAAYLAARAAHDTITVVHTDPSSTLAKTLASRRDAEAKRKQAQAAADRGKRAAECGSAGRAPKRAAGGASPAGGGAGPSGAGGAVPSAPTAAPDAAALRGKTVKELQELLNARGLPTSGRKDDLVARLAA
jgi:hypothetical protein